MAPDPYDLNRFLIAQEDTYREALAEIRAGRKASHWMWFIFPQLKGLGSSPTSIQFAIGGREEAKAYLTHAILGPRLVECADAVLQIRGRSALEIFGSPDNMKLRSSATLFAAISTDGSVFHGLIDKYFNGEPDVRTVQLLASSEEPR